MRKSKILDRLEEARIDYMNPRIRLVDFLKMYQVSNGTARKLFGQKPTIINTRAMTGHFQTNEEILAYQRNRTKKAKDELKEMIKETAKLLGLTEWKIQEYLDQGNTFTEIRSGKWVNGVFKIPTLIKIYY